MKHIFICCFCSIFFLSCNSNLCSTFLLMVNDSTYEIEWVSTIESPSGGLGSLSHYMNAVYVCHSDVFSDVDEKDITIEDMCFNLGDAEIKAYAIFDDEKTLLKSWKGSDRFKDKRSPFCLNHCEKRIGTNVDASRYINYYFHVTNDDFDTIK